MPAPLLFVGDIHLGRTPQRLAAAGLHPHELGPAEAWRRVVREAERREVQAVVLAGDVVDQDKDRFEAWAHLRDGVAQLLGAGVRVLGVAGNHDHIALPRLADRIPAFHLIGRGGMWERVALDGVDLVGWSFPSRHHRSNPLLSPNLDAVLEGRRMHTATIGVLHCDLDAGASPYAPVPGAELVALGLAAWFLGHIHQPHDLGVASPVGYLGSLVGLDRSETGPRGPWLVAPTSASTVEARQLALGPVHWIDLEVDVSGIAPGDDAHDRLHVALESRVAEVEAENDWVRDGPFSAVGCSVTLTGRTAAGAEIRRFLADRGADELVFERGGARWAVVQMQDRTRPERDLSALAQERTPVGQLARLLVDLDEVGAGALPAEVLRAVEHFDTAPWSSDLERDPLPDRVDVVRQAALVLLDQLLAQQGAAEVR